MSTCAKCGKTEFDASIMWTVGQPQECNFCIADERDELRRRVTELEGELHAAIEQRSLVLERRDEAIAEAVMRERKACADIVEDASIAADFRASNWAGFGADVRARERIMLAIELRESAAAIRARGEK